MKSLIISLATAVVVFLSNLFLLKIASTYFSFDATSLAVHLAFVASVGILAGLGFFLFVEIFGPKTQNRNKKKQKADHSNKVLALIIAHTTFSFEFVFYPGTIGKLAHIADSSALLTYSAALALLVGAVSYWLSYLNNRTKLAGDVKYDGSIIPNGHLLAGIVFAVLCIAIIPSSMSFEAYTDRQKQKSVARIYDAASQQLFYHEQLHGLAMRAEPVVQQSFSALTATAIESAAALRTRIQDYAAHHALDIERTSALPENDAIITLRQNYLAAARSMIGENISAQRSADLQKLHDEFVQATIVSISAFRELEEVTESAYQQGRFMDFMIGAVAFIGLALGLFWPLLQLIQAQRAALNVRVKQAESALVAKSQFLATMSHELRTPMNGVLGMVRLLIDSGLNAQQQSHADTALQSGENLLTILNDILNYTKIESGQMELEIVPFSPKRLVQDSVSLLQLQARAKGLEMSCAIHNRVPASVKADPTRIQQILINLLGNALKFTKKGSIQIKIFYKGTSSNGKLIFEVADTGVGIPKKAQARIFDHFSQADETITRKFGGTGLGLAISKQLVDLMKGKIGVKSTEGFGSTFWFTVPVSVAHLRAKPVVEKPVEQAPAAPVAPATLKVLIAEDNLVNQQIISAFVKAAGHELEMVDNGEKAVNAVAEKDFDVVLMDIQMPVMDGVTATRQIRTFSDKKGKIPIIAVTANAMEGDREKYMEAGMDGYIAKPVNPQNLNEALKGLIAETGASAGNGAATASGKDSGKNSGRAEKQHMPRKALAS